MLLTNKKNKYNSQQIRRSINDKRNNNPIHDKSFDQWRHTNSSSHSVPSQSISKSKLIQSYTKRNELRILSNITYDDHKFNAENDKEILKQMKLKDMHIYCGICPPEYKFTHKPSELLSLACDAYLGSRILVKYWFNRNVSCEGELTCISHSGFIRLQDFYYDDYKCDLLDEYELPRSPKGSYWFHYKCITEIWLWNNETNAFDIDFKPMVFDLLKLKVIQEMEYIHNIKVHDFMDKIINNMDDEDTVNVMDVLNNRSANDMVNGYFDQKFEVNKKGQMIIKWRRHNISKRKQSSNKSKRKRFSNAEYEIFFIMFLKYKNKEQIKWLRFTRNEIADIMTGYIDICRFDTRLNDIMDEIEQERIRNMKIREKKSSNFMRWDDDEIEKLSKQRIKRTV